MNSTLIGITGGTGVGKSTLCVTLQNKYPDKIGIIQLDDFFKPEDHVPTLSGLKNWDHPDALFLDKLVHSLSELAQGNSVVIHTRSDKLIPNHKNMDERIPATFHPKPIMLVDGFLALYDERVRNLLATSMWLETQHDIRWERRVFPKLPGYEEKVLKPMYERYAAPTKQYADFVIDVTALTKEQVLQRTEELLDHFLFSAD